MSDMQVEKPIPFLEESSFGERPLHSLPSGKCHTPIGAESLKLRPSREQVTCRVVSLSLLNNSKKGINRNDSPPFSAGAVGGPGRS